MSLTVKSFTTNGGIRILVADFGLGFKVSGSGATDGQAAQELARAIEKMAKPRPPAITEQQAYEMKRAVMEYLA